MRPLLAVLVASPALVLAVAECTRAPAEETYHPNAATVAPAAPPATAAPPVGRIVLTSDAGEARCVHLTPSAPPPQVPPGPAPGCPADPEASPPVVPVVRVAFPDTSGVAVDAELVSTEHDTTRGLMYRKSMGEERGMLFNLGVRVDHKFWMHNTCIPLDLLFVDDDGLIVGIVESAPTLNDDARSVGCPSRWVLEVNAGWARRHGVKAGQSLKLP